MANTRPSLGFLAVAAALAGCAYGCTLYDTSMLEPGDAAGSAGASGSAAGSSGTGGSSGTSGTSGASGASGMAGMGGAAGSAGMGGAAGSAGTAGSSGMAGNAGTAGSGGMAGSAGTAGMAGSAGTAGMAGSAGTAGMSGMAGSAGTAGMGGMAGSAGTAGMAGSGGGGGNPLLITEYVEGTSNNKALEITNTSGTDTVDLSKCTFRLFANGNTSANPVLPLSGMLGPGQVYSLCDDSIGMSANCTVKVPNNLFNGNDAIELSCDNQTVDVFGQIGVNPGTEWTGGGVKTANVTLRRKCSVMSGDTNGSDAFDPSLEWDQFGTDEFGDLGMRQCSN